MRPGVHLVFVEGPACPRHVHEVAHGAVEEFGLVLDCSVNVLASLVKNRFRSTWRTITSVSSVRLVGKVSLYCRSSSGVRCVH